MYQSKLSPFDENYVGTKPKTLIIKSLMKSLKPESILKVSIAFVCAISFVMFFVWMACIKYLLS